MWATNWSNNADKENKSPRTNATHLNNFRSSAGVALDTKEDQYIVFWMRVLCLYVYFICEISCRIGLNISGSGTKRFYLTELTKFSIIPADTYPSFLDIERNYHTGRLAEFSVQNIYKPDPTWKFRPKCRFARQSLPLCFFFMFNLDKPHLELYNWSCPDSNLSLLLFLLITQSQRANHNNTLICNTSI